MWKSRPLLARKSLLVLLAVLLAHLSTTAVAEEPPVFLLEWGAKWPFQSPSGVAVDGSGNVYVTDIALSQIVKFTSAGVFLTKWGSAGSANGQFSNPSAIASDGSGNVYVTAAVSQNAFKIGAPL